MKTLEVLTVMNALEEIESLDKIYFMVEDFLVDTILVKGQSIYDSLFQIGFLKRGHYDVYAEKIEKEGVFNVDLNKKVLEVDVKNYTLSDTETNRIKLLTFEVE